MKPGLNVIITDNLCQSEALRQTIQQSKIAPAVLAGCSHLRSDISLWQEPEKCIVDPDSVGIVDLVREIDSSFQDIDLLERAKILLWSQVKRQETFRGVPEKARKARFVRIQGEVSRRDLFQSLVPKYSVIPYIDSAKCLGWKCRICRAACTFKAIIAEDEAVSIDSSDCKACGLCITSCPHQAIVYPNFAIEQLEAQIEGLLLDADTKLQPRIIAMVCQSTDTKVNPFKQTPNVLPIEVPCMGMVSPRLILRAFDLGAQGFLMISNKDKCQFKLDCTDWKGTVQFVQQLLAYWGIEPERIGICQEGQLDKELAAFRSRIAALNPTVLVSAKANTTEKGIALPAVISAMTEKLGAAAIGAITSGTVPFGKVTVDASKCTSCGVCAAQCPTEALSGLSGKDSSTLLFRQDSCVGCGQCMDICPEKCLTLVKVLEVNKLNHEPQVIFENDFVRCRSCGTPVAPKAMIEAVRSRLGTTGEAASRLEMCPGCRMKGKPRLAKSGVGA